MPLYIRKLPASVSKLIETDAFPAHVAVFNPSRAGKHLYIRVTQHTNLAESNHALMHDIETRQTHEIECPYDKLSPHVNMFNGIEDFRIALHDGKVWFAGTTTHASDYMNNELIVGHFNPSVTAIETLHRVDIGSRPVKNVCPFVWNGKLVFLDVYKACIREMVHAEDASYHAPPLKPLQWTQPEWAAIGLRGSTSPVHLHGNLWGFVAHDIIFNDNSKLVTRLSYIHYWVEFDIERGYITSVSSPFFVAHWGIEYISGIHQQTDGKIVLYIGIGDKQCLQCTTTLNDLRVGK